MPVSLLLVEGKLDGAVLNPILAGNPTIETDCPKGSLAPRCRDKRRNGLPNVCYLRDRDYDYEPPASTVEPIVDREFDGATLGWHWSRHEIENYLLDPAVVVAATGWDLAEYSTGLVAAGRRIRDYQVARWSVGRVKRDLPPATDLRGRPVEFHGEFQLPDDLSSTATSLWARKVIAEFRSRVSTLIEPSAFDSLLAERAASLTDALLSTSEAVLTWCSGKDVFTALGAWLRRGGRGDGGNLRVRLRDWVMENPERTVELLPEWKRLREILRQY